MSNPLAKHHVTVSPAKNRAPQFHYLDVGNFFRYKNYRDAGNVYVKISSTSALLLAEEHIYVVDHDAAVEKLASGTHLSFTLG